MDFLEGVFMTIGVLFFFLERSCLLGGIFMDEVEAISAFLSSEENIKGLETFLLFVSFMSFGGFIPLRFSKYISP